MTTDTQEQPKPTEQNTSPKTETNNENKRTGDGKAWGYDLYPERKQIYRPSFKEVLTMEKGRETFEKIRCEENVWKCVKSSPLVKLMMSALKKSGW